MMTLDAHLDEPRKRIIAGLRDCNIGMNDLSRRIGKNKVYIYQYLYSGTPKVLSEQVREAIGPILNIDPDLLKSKSADLPNIPLTSPDSRHTSFKNNGLAFFEGARDVPVFQAHILRRGNSELSIDAIDSAHRPANLLSVPGAFCLVASGMQLSPRYRPGDMLFFHPFQPPLEGDGVAVQLKEGPKVLGILRSYEVDGPVTIETLNPPASETYSVDQYVSVSREVGTTRR